MADLTHVKGLAELSAKLKALPPRIAKNALRRAVSAGAAVIRKEAKRLAPISAAPRKRGNGAMSVPGTLKRAAMSFSIREQSNQVQQTFGVAFKSGKKEQAKSRDAYYWKWVEAGHRIIPRRGKSGNSLKARRNMHRGGFVQGRRFLRDAFTASAPRAIAAIEAKLRADIDKLTQG